MTQTDKNNEEKLKHRINFKLAMVGRKEGRVNAKSQRERTKNEKKRGIM